MTHSIFVDIYSTVALNAVMMTVFPSRVARNIHYLDLQCKSNQ